MAEILTYDPSNDPQAIQAEQRDAETLAIGEQMEADQEQMLAGKYRNAQELESAYLELQKKLGDGEEPAEGEDVEYPDVDEEPSEDPVADFITAAEQEFAETGELTWTYEQFKLMSY